MSRKKYFFAKLNVNGNIFFPDLNTIINKLIPNAIINNENEIPYYQNKFGFTDTRIISFGGNKFIHGNLTKSRKIKTLVKDGNVTKEKEFDELGAFTSEFFYDIKNEIIVYKPTSDISNEHFLRFFKELIETDYRIGELIIIPYQKENSIRAKIKSFDVVTNINFYLIKPNPGKREFYEFENIIKENNLKQLDLKMENKDGIKIQKNEKEFTDSIESGLSLVEKAYGTVEVKGYNNVVIKVPGKKDKVNRRRVSATSAKFNRFITLKQTDVRDMVKKIGEEISKILS